MTSVIDVVNIICRPLKQPQAMKVWHFEVDLIRIEILNADLRAWAFSKHINNKLRYHCIYILHWQTVGYHL